MASHPQSSLPQRFARVVLRPLLVFITFALVLMAILQAGGRFTMAVVHVFEDELNAILASQNISVAGLRGSWRGLNPRVSVESVVFPAGQIARMELELDVLESILRNAWVPHTLTVAGAEVHLVQAVQGWRLRGQGGELPQLNLNGLLRHSDHLEGRLDLLLHPRTGDMARLQADLKLINHSQMHFAQLGVWNAAVADKRLQLDFWQTDAVLAQGSMTATLSGSLALPVALTGFSEVLLEVTQGGWAEQYGKGEGALGLAFDGLSLSANGQSLAGNVHLAAGREAQRIKFSSSPLTLQAGADQLVISSVYGQSELPRKDESALTAAADFLQPKDQPPLAQLWFDALNLDEINRFLVTHFAGFERLVAWLDGLAVRGEANNLHLFYKTDTGFGYEASLNRLSVTGFRGVPTLRNARARVWGYTNGHVVQVSGNDVYLQFPDLYASGWDLASVQGIVKIWLGTDYLGVQGTHIRTRLGDTVAAGSFAITRPQETSGQRLSLQISADQTSVTQAKTFVPDNIPPALDDWLQSGLQSGRLSDARFVYHGQVRVAPGELARRNELTADFSGLRVAYEPNWPAVYDAVGNVHVAGSNVHIEIQQGASESLSIRTAEVTLHDNATYLSGTVDVTGDATNMLSFVRNSPLQTSLAFITPAWQGSGRVDLTATLTVPIRAEQAPPLTVDLNFELGQMDLAMPEYRLVVRNLRGRGAFSLPHHLTGEFNGELFGQPAVFTASHTPQWLNFDVTGRATPVDVYNLLAADVTLPLAGEFSFSSVLKLPMDGGVMQLLVNSDLQGLQIGLPAEFGKLAQEASPIDIDVQFLANYQSVALRYKTIDGWFHYGDGIERGAIGIDADPPMTTVDQRAIAISGSLPRLVLSEWVSREGDSAVALPLDWTISKLAVREFVIDELSFADVLLDGQQQGADVAFTFEAPSLRGKLLLPAADVLNLDLAYLQIPQTDVQLTEPIDAPQADPISVAVGEVLPAAKVNIDQLVLGEEPFGRWRFEIEPRAGASVRFSNLDASVNGVHIEGGELNWDLQKDRSAFAGALKLDNLEQTLPMWDYAPSLSTTSASARADVSWSGSPLNVSLLGADGEIEFQAHDGRFVEVEAGAGGLRILSLLNFTQLAKRISLDFSDVVGEGMSFEHIDATVGLHNGELTFPKRLTVESSSGDFQLGGRVDLASGELNNELIVTLPVSKSIPWYGLYLGLANPIVGATVVLGERMLRKPIEQFSTAKFEVTGTLEDPQVKFVSLWDRSMKEPQGRVQAQQPEQPE
ncbi:MAG: YhdP family protein [bacterium]